MAEESQKQEALGAGGTSAGEEKPAKPSVPTRYMVLWAPKPDDGDPIKWREIGWYEAHSKEAAEEKAKVDQASGVYGQLIDAGKTRGVYLRAVAQRSWPDECEIHTVEQPPPEWRVGGRKGEE